MKFHLVSTIEVELAVADRCCAIGVSEQGYYESLRRPTEPTAHDRIDEMLAQRLRLKDTAVEENRIRAFAFFELPIQEGREMLGDRRVSDIGKPHLLQASPSTA